jgi:hypothetical protein
MPDQVEDMLFGIMRRSMLLLDEFIGRNGHDDLARVEFDEIGEREHRDIADPTDQADENEKSEQTRHDRGPATARAGRFSSMYDHVS